MIRLTICLFGIIAIITRIKNSNAVQILIQLCLKIGISFRICTLKVIRNL